MTQASPDDRKAPNQARDSAHAPPWLWLPLLVLMGLVDPIFGVAVKLIDLVWRPRLPSRADTPLRRRRGLTLVLGGIEGPSIYNHQIVCGILRSGYRGSVVRFDWNAGIPFWRSLVNLVSRRHHDTQARRLIEDIRQYRREHPRAPVNLVAQSGGCWIVLRALERLPEEASVYTAVLLAAAVSRGHDVRPAAARCTCALVSIRSFGDFFFLGLGTLLLGTSDRAFAPAAGLIGWRRSAPNFCDWRWRPAWLEYGYAGNHTTSGAPRFLAAVIAPHLGRLTGPPPPKPPESDDRRPHPPLP